MIFPRHPRSNLSSDAQLTETPPLSPFNPPPLEPRAPGDFSSFLRGAHNSRRLSETRRRTARMETTPTYLSMTKSRDRDSVFTASSSFTRYSRAGSLAPATRERINTPRARSSAIARSIEKRHAPCAADLSSVRSVTGGAQVGCTGRYACAPTCSCVFLFLSLLSPCLSVSLRSRRVRVSYPQLPSLAPSRPLFLLLLLLLSLPPSSRSRFLQRAGIRKIDTRDRSPRERASERANARTPSSAENACSRREGCAHSHGNRIAFPGLSGESRSRFHGGMSGRNDRISAHFYRERASERAREREPDLFSLPFSTQKKVRLNQSKPGLYVANFLLTAQ